MPRVDLIQCGEREKKSESESEGEREREGESEREGDPERERETVLGISFRSLTRGTGGYKEYPAELN